MRRSRVEGGRGGDGGRGPLDLCSDKEATTVEVHWSLGHGRAVRDGSREVGACCPQASCGPSGPSPPADHCSLDRRCHHRGAAGAGGAHLIRAARPTPSWRLLGTTSAGGHLGHEGEGAQGGGRPARHKQRPRASSPPQTRPCHRDMFLTVGMRRVELTVGCGVRRACPVPACASQGPSPRVVFLGSGDDRWGVPPRAVGPPGKRAGE